MIQSSSSGGLALALERHASQRLLLPDQSLDASQRQALEAMAEWLEAALMPHRGWRRRPPAGIYLWGSVGRGKSLLMDALFEVAPVTSKRRVHFHGFLQELQQRSLSYSGQADPLALVARDIAGQAKLLCFDEFHVHDIGDATLLGRLIRYLLEAGVLLVLTSNYAPAALCPNPLHHQRFKPFIRLIEQRLRILELDSPTDYRTVAPRDWGLYCWSDSPGPHPLIDAQFAGALPGVLQLDRFCLASFRQREQGVWFRFSELFERPTSTRDYLELCSRFADLAVSEIPALSGLSLDVQQRFLNFVDIAYDAGARLWLSSEVSLAALCQGAVQQDFSRTCSRLAQLRQVGPEFQPTLG
ncbi:cell division protein ZapE [Stutzerimonas azotifigens]|uniref:Cell division protein ZapE n=1 Tax=Stutzerimonas azotifigens TaxID=291995 RepID=A0ABR5Z7E8_9GAMM|nr:cell division protein ZapE [Stutzerimonas azotifigens]MBA1276084.1 cell division protein ZapE [Stutzerimonas azotifigens]